MAEATFTLCVLVPCEIRSEANLREHWRRKHARTSLQKSAVAWALAKHKPPTNNPPAIKVTLTRIGARRLDDDNLAGGFKAVRDAVARWLGIDDGSDRFQWVYAQRTDKKSRCAEILVEWQV